jgi:hypothetical protein
MSNEVTIRVKSTPEILVKAKQLATQVTPLDDLSGSFWKPKGTDLKSFPPSEVVIRLRTFPDGTSKAEQLTTMRDGASYTVDSETILKGPKDECWQKLVQLGNEPWVEYRQSATEYKIQLNGEVFNMLDEMFDGESSTIKFEASNEDIVWEFLHEFDLSQTDVINLNTAELLAQRNNIPYLAI